MYPCNPYRNIDARVSSWQSPANSPPRSELRGFECQNHPGWPYGAFLIDRYTTWNATSRNLTVAYLMSTSSPFQVQLMETTLMLPDPVV